MPNRLVLDYRSVLATIVDHDRHNSTTVVSAVLNHILKENGPEAIAIRKRFQHTSIGRWRNARQMPELQSAGIVVVSGLAFGVDSEAMRAALAAGGKTIGVIGTPIDACSPFENAQMQQEIYEKHLLLSQFRRGQSVSKGNFPMRNRLMAALTDATVVIEASNTSGTLHQAAECSKLGRWLFIAKSILDSPGVEWPRTFTRYPTTKILSHASDVINTLLRDASDLPKSLEVLRCQTNGDRDNRVASIEG